MIRIQHIASAILLLASINTVAVERLPSFPINEAGDSNYGNSIGLAYGISSKNKKADIDTREFYYQKRLPLIDGFALEPFLEANITQITVSKEKGYSYGIGPGISIPIQDTGGRLSFISHAKIHYLARSDYHMKDYGGPLHWSYLFGIKAKLTRNTFASYGWQHLSNGDIYEKNPALEEHRFTIGIKF